jgi:hypothetical protein
MRSWPLGCATFSATRSRSGTQRRGGNRYAPLARSGWARCGSTPRVADRRRSRLKTLGRHQLREPGRSSSVLAGSLRGPVIDAATAVGDAGVRQVRPGVLGPRGALGSSKLCWRVLELRVNEPIARVLSSTRASTRSPLGDGAERMSGTSGTAQDEEGGRPAPGESRVQPRHNDERERRCWHALVVVG